MSNAKSSMGCAFLALASISLIGVATAQNEPSRISHGFLATGARTYILDGKGREVWSFPHPSRDGWVLPNGHILLALAKSGSHPGGAVIEVDREGKQYFQFEGTQSEVNTVQPLDEGRILLTEAGDNPRILEVDRFGKVLVEVRILAQTKDHHLQTRMTRKLSNGNYLVPQLLEKVVREYSPKGTVVWEAKTPNWPFTAIRLENGNTLIACTVGNLVIEVAPDGQIVWKVSNEELEGKPIADACGVQRLPNGHTVITSYRAQGEAVKLTEVTPQKKVVWTHRDPARPGIHHFQILSDTGDPLAGRPLR